jgi:hypothetical protein
MVAMHSHIKSGMSIVVPLCWVPTCGAIRQRCEQSIQGFGALVVRQSPSAVWPTRLGILMSISSSRRPRISRSRTRLFVPSQNSSVKDRILACDLNGEMDALQFQGVPLMFVVMLRHLMRPGCDAISPKTLQSFPTTTASHGTSWSRMDAIGQWRSQGG